MLLQKDNIIEVYKPNQLQYQTEVGKYELLKTKFDEYKEKMIKTREAFEEWLKKLNQQMIEKHDPTNLNLKILDTNTLNKDFRTKGKHIFAEPNNELGDDGYKASQKNLLNIIKILKPHIITFQEIDCQGSIRNMIDLENYFYILAGKNTNPFQGTATVIRMDIKDTEGLRYMYSVNLTPGALDKDNKAPDQTILVSFFKLDDGTVLSITNVHMKSGEAIEYKDGKPQLTKDYLTRHKLTMNLKKLLKHMAVDFQIVIGDFNTWSENDVGSDMLADGDLIDLTEELFPTTCKFNKEAKQVNGYFIHNADTSCKDKAFGSKNLNATVTTLWAKFLSQENLPDYVKDTKDYINMTGFFHSLMTHADHDLLLLLTKIAKKNYINLPVEVKEALKKAYNPRITDKLNRKHK